MSSSSAAVTAGCTSDVQDESEDGRIRGYRTRLAGRQLRQTVASSDVADDNTSTDRGLYSGEINHPAYISRHLVRVVVFLFGFNHRELP